MDMKNSTNWIIIGAIAVIVIVGGWWLFSTKPADESGTSTSNSNVVDISTGTPVDLTVPSTPYATTTAAGETVMVQDQSAGMGVSITSMNLTRETWVAVRDSRSILGAGRFSPGATSGTVKLLRATEVGKAYQVVVYVDDGDKKFDFKVDAVVPGVGSTFTAQ